MTMLEEIGVYLMTRWANNRTKILSYEGSMCPKIMKILEEEHVHFIGQIPTWIGDKKFEVVFNILTKFIDDLDRKWQLTTIPCCNAISYINWCSKNLEDYISFYY